MGTSKGTSSKLLDRVPVPPLVQPCTSPCDVLSSVLCPPATVPSHSVLPNTLGRPCMRPTQRPSYPARICRRCFLFYRRGLLLAERERESSWLRVSLGLRERPRVSGSGDCAGSRPASSHGLRERPLVSDSGDCAGSRPAPSHSCCWPPFAHLATRTRRRPARAWLFLLFWDCFFALPFFHWEIVPSPPCCCAAGGVG